MPETVDPSIVVDVWVVPDGGQEEFMQALVSLFERLRTLEGFLDGQILQGVDPTLFVSYATMRSARDCDAAFLDPELRAITRSLGGMARPAPHAFTIARSFTPAASGQPGD